MTLRSGHDQHAVPNCGAAKQQWRTATLHHSDKAVVLVNLGTPDEPTPSAIRRYLRQFLSDRRTVDLPPALWYPLLYGFILPFRPAKLVSRYRAIWGSEDSPIREIGGQVVVALRDALSQGPGTPPAVRLAMTYGNPAIADCLRELREEGRERVLVLPLFPQYSGATTAAAFDQVARGLARSRRIPELRFVNDYHDHPLYIEALADSIRGDYRAGKVLFSFHSIPMSQVRDGDIYPEQCRRTADLLASALDLDDDAWTMSYQSRIGRAEWLGPYTDATLEALAGDGVESVTVVCPGFAADCLETLEEIDIEGRRLFLDAGGKTFHYVAALNSREAHIALLGELVSKHLAEW